MEVLKTRPIAVDVKPWIGTIQIVMAAICWGTLGIFSTYLSQLGFSSWQITILRIITAAIIAIAMLPKIWKPLSRLTLGQWFGLGLQSLVGVLGMTVCYLFAVLHVGAGPAVALLYTAPVFSLIFSHLLLDERITYKAALLAIVAVIGVGMTTMGGTTEGKLGIAVGLLSGVCYSLYGVLGKRAMHHKHSAPLVFFTSILFSGIVLLFIPTTYTTYYKLIQLPVISWIYVLGLSLVGTIAPFALYMKALEKLPATRASVFTIFEPLTAIFLAVLLLHQMLSGIQYIGVFLILLVALLNGLTNSTNVQLPRWFRRQKLS